MEISELGITTIHQHLNEKKDLKIESNKKKIFVFVSEPIIESYRGNYFCGYTQLTILQSLITALNDYIIGNGNNNFEFLVKAHPKENKSNYSLLFDSYRHRQRLFSKPVSVFSD